MFSNKKVIRFLTQTIAALLGIAIGIVLGWLAIRGAEWSAVKESLRSVSLATLMLALLIALLSSWIRVFFDAEKNVGKRRVRAFERVLVSSKMTSYRRSYGRSFSGRFATRSKPLRS